MSATANIKVAASNNSFFSGSTANDVIFYTGIPSQRLMFGTSNGSTPSLVVASNIVYTNTNFGIMKSNPQYALDIGGDINFTGVLRQSGTSYVGSQWSNFQSNVFIMTSNVAIGKSNASYPLDVVGDMNFTGTLRQNGAPYVGSQWSNFQSNVFIMTSNIAIGKSNAAYPLDVVGDMNFTGILRQNGVPHVSSQWSNFTSNVFMMTSNVAIGKSNAAYPLDVVGDMNFTGTLRQNGAPYVGSQWSNTSSNVFIMGSNIAVGKSNAAYMLDVSGDVGFGGNINLVNKYLSLSGLRIVKDTSGGISANVTSTVSTIPGFTNTAASNLDVFCSSNAASNYVRIMASSVEIARFCGNCNVGIGVQSPTYSLDVAGSLHTNNTLYLDSSNTSVQVFFSNHVGASAQIGLATSNTNFSTDAKSNDLVVRNMYTNGRILLQNNLNASALCIASNNYVGVGTTIPTTKFDVRGTIAASNYVTPSTTAAAPATGVLGGTGDRLILYQGSVSAYPSAIGIGLGTLWNSVPASNQFQWYINGGAVMTLSNNSLGVNVSAPSFPIEVKAVNAAHTIGSFSSCNSYMFLGYADIATRFNALAKVGDIVFVSYSNFNQNTSGFVIGPNTGTYGRGIRIDGPTGQVGIGLSNPAAMLHVNGDAWTNKCVALTDGTSNAPCFSWSNDTNTGIFHPANDELAIAINGKNMLHVTTGAIGVGKSNPMANLDVSGIMQASTVRVDSSSTLTTQGIYLMWNRIGSGMTCFANQRGLGAGGFEFINYQLDGVTSNSSFTITDSLVSTSIPSHQIGNSTTSSELYLTDVATAGWKLQTSNSRLSFLNDQTGSYIAKAVITNTGQVGIGLSNPSYPLDVNGTMSASNICFRAGSAVPSLGTLGGEGDKLILYPGNPVAYPLSIGVSGFTMWHSVPAFNQFQWYTNGVVGMTLSNNLLGIGTSTPTTVLDVSGAIHTNNVLYLDSTSLPNQINFSNNKGGSAQIGMAYNDTQFGTYAKSNDLMVRNMYASGRILLQVQSNATAICVGSNNNVGIYTTTPSYRLHVDGTIYATGDITAFSDIRKKMNLEIIQNALDKMDKISGYTFDMVEPIKDAEQRHVTTRHAGVIAQEVEAILPEVIYEDEKGYKGVAYGNLTALLIQAVKELRAKVDVLEAKLESLESITCQGSSPSTTNPV